MGQTETIIDNNMTEKWTKKEVIDRISLLSKKYHSGYVDKDPNAPIHKFQQALKEMEFLNTDEIEISNFNQNK